MSRCRRRALLGELHQGWAPLSRVIDQAAVALAAEMCGAAQRVLDMTVDYAKMRIAFGKPIGSYQGVKHKCADMLIEIENAKSLTYYAAWAVDEGDPEAAHGGIDGQGRGLRCRPQGVRRRHPAAWRHRHDLGARSAPLLEARQGRPRSRSATPPGTASASPRLLAAA